MATTQTQRRAFNEEFKAFRKLSDAYFRDLHGGARPLLSAQFVQWVASLPLTNPALSVDRQPLVWCEEHHYWHATTSECDYA